MPSYNFRVNGFARTVDFADPDQPLLYVLRNFGLTQRSMAAGSGNAAPAMCSSTDVRCNPAR